MFKCPDTWYFSYRVIAQKAMNPEAPLYIHFVVGTNYTRSDDMAIMKKIMVSKIS